MAANKAGKLGKGRIPKLAPIVNFLFIERGIVMTGDRLNGVMLRRIGLDYNPTPQDAAPGSPRHLS